MKLSKFGLLASVIFFACHSQHKNDQRSTHGKRPNILFIYSDDHATAGIGAYANSVLAPHVRTPNIDALARSGLRFDRAFCSNSICAPARAVVLTGKHSHSNGVKDNNDVFDGTQITFPKLLRKSGYQTALIGKWHLKSVPTGFDYFDILPGQGDYYTPQFQRPGADFVEGSIDAKDALERRRIEGYVTEVTTDLALNWLTHRRTPDKPFLLMVQHKAPHRSWMPGPDEHSLYRSESLPEPATLFDDYAGRASGAGTQEMSIKEHMWLWHDLKLRPADWGVDPAQIVLEGPDSWTAGLEARMDAAQLEAWDAAYSEENAAFGSAIRSGQLGGRQLTSWKYQRYIKDYLRCIAAVDKSVGQLRNWLKENNLEQDTLVIYSSDQGFFLGEHGWYDKRWMYEPSMQVPLIMSWPGSLPVGVVDEHLVQNLDLAPTLLEVAGLRPPKEMQGLSLLPILCGQAPNPRDWRSSIYYRYYEVGVHAVPEHYGVRSATHKLIHYFNLDQWELFDLVEDPQELHNRYSDVNYAHVRSELELQLQRLREQYGENT